MTGQDLYARYVDAQADLNNCQVDAWDELEDGERKVWNAIAYTVRALEATLPVPPVRPEEEPRTFILTRKRDNQTSRADSIDSAVDLLRAEGFDTEAPSANGGQSIRRQLEQALVGQQLLLRHPFVGQNGNSSHRLLCVAPGGC